MSKRRNNGKFKGPQVFCSMRTKICHDFLTSEKEMREKHTHKQDKGGKK